MHPDVEPQQLKAQDALLLQHDEAQDQPVTTDPDPPIQIRHSPRQNSPDAGHQLMPKPAETRIQIPKSTIPTDHGHDKGLDRTLIASSHIESR